MMAPWSDPAVLALAAGDVVHLRGEPVVTEEQLVAGSGLLAVLQGSSLLPKDFVFLQSTPTAEVLGLVVSCLLEARRRRAVGESHPGHFLRVAIRAWEYLDGDGLGMDRLRQTEVALLRDRAAHLRRESLTFQARTLLVLAERRIESVRKPTPIDRAEQAAYEAAVLEATGKVREAVELLERRASELEASDWREEGRLLLYRLQVQAGALVGLVDPSAAVATLRRVPPTDTPFLTELADMAATWWQSATGDLGAVQEHLPRLRRASQHPIGEITLAWTQARILARRNRLDEADGLLNQVWSILLGVSDYLLWQLVASGELMVVAAKRGDRKCAEAVVAHATAMLASRSKSSALQRAWQDLLTVFQSATRTEAMAKQVVERTCRDWCRQIAVIAVTKKG